MNHGIIGSSLRFRYLILVITFALFLFGLAQIRGMPVDVLPEFSPPLVEIQTEALGLSAEEVEQLITVPMEQDLLAGVAWVDVIRSESVPGLSSVLLIFEPGTDLYRARQMVSERLSQAAVGLPHVSKPPTMIQPLSSSSRFMIVGLSSKEVSLIEMSVLARWVIGPRLMGVPGVANVAIWGNRDRQLQVQVDPEKLRAQGVSLQQVLSTTGNALWVSSLSYLEASTPGTGGFIDTPNQRIGIWHVLPISSPEELAQVPIEDANGLQLSSVARVVEDHQPLIGDALVNDGPSLMLVVEKLPGTNTLDVTRGVEAALAALQPGLKGIEFDTSLFRPASFLESAAKTLSNRLIAGAVLVVFGLLFLLWGWRTALIGIVTIPMALLGALLVFYLRGETVNSMVLAGLAMAIGVIIDDAVVGVEHIVRRIRQRGPGETSRSIASIILEASLELRGALLFATLILLLTALPLFFLPEVTQQFFQPMVVTYVLGVLASTLVAMIVTPALSMILLGERAPANGQAIRQGSPLAAWVQRRYDRLLSSTLRRPGLAFLTATLLLVASLAAIPFIRNSSWLPTFKEPNILIQWEAAPGTSRPAMQRIVSLASHELRALPGVRDVGAHVGRAVFGDQVVGINSAQLWVNIDPAADYNATLTAIREVVDSYPGLTREVSSSLQQTLRQPFPQASGAADENAITVRVFGENFEVLRGLADEVKQSLTGIPGIQGLQVKLPVEEPTLEIEVDLAAAQRHGVKPGDVRRAAATLLSGLQVGSLFEEQKVFDVVVWSTPETRQSLTNIGDLLIETPGGGHIRLKEVADVRIAPAPTVIQRSGVSPYLDVGIQVSGRNINAVMREIKTVLPTIQYPLEYHTEVISDYAQRQAALQRILVAGLVALVGIFLLLQAVCGSWRLAVVTLLALPAALGGGVLAAILAIGGQFSLGALLGLFTLFGIAVRNSVLLIRHYQQLEDEEGVAFGPELVLRGAGDRAAPVFITAFVLVLALAPFVATGEAPGLEILYPMAIVIMGGLVTSTLLNLFVMPAVYLRFGASREADLELMPALPGDTRLGDPVAGD